MDNKTCYAPWVTAGQKYDPKLSELIDKTHNYIVTVLKCQKRWLDCSDMYQGYKASFKKVNQISKDNFEITYNEIKSMCKDNPNFFNQEGNN